MWLLVIMFNVWLLRLFFKKKSDKHQMQQSCVAKVAQLPREKRLTFPAENVSSSAGLVSLPVKVQPIVHRNFLRGLAPTSRFLWKYFFLDFKERRRTLIVIQFHPLCHDLN